MQIDVQNRLFSRFVVNHMVVPYFLEHRPGLGRCNCHFVSRKVKDSTVGIFYTEDSSPCRLPKSPAMGTPSLAKWAIPVGGGRIPKKRSQSYEHWSDSKSFTRPKSFTRRTSSFSSRISSFARRTSNFQPPSVSAGVPYCRAPSVDRWFPCFSWIGGPEQELEHEFSGCVILPSRMSAS